MPNPPRFHSASLDAHPNGQDVQTILDAAFQAADPAECVRSALSLQGDCLQVLDQEIALQPGRKVAMIAVGKAAPAMAAAAQEILGARLGEALMIPKTTPQTHPAGMRVIPGGHPLPTEASLAAGSAALTLAASLDEKDLILCLISGGGSALMSAPVEGISLTDLQALTASLLACGASITEINCLRRRLDRVKGGGLARAAAPAHVVSLILSDVIGSPLEAIASGPTVPDPTSRADALAILAKYGLTSSAPAVVLSALREGAESDQQDVWKSGSVLNRVIGDNAQATAAALNQAARLGYNVRNLGSAWQGEARQVGMELSALLKRADLPRPFCLVAGGETTVTLRGAGKGGRNQELALAAVEALAGQEGLMLVSLATDGEDGPTDAAGAVVTGETLRHGLSLDLSPADHLARNDAYPYFAALGDLLITGPSGTNVNDLVFLFGF